MPTNPDTEKVEPSIQPGAARSARVMRRPDEAATLKQRTDEVIKAPLDNLNRNVKKDSSL